MTTEKQVLTIQKATLIKEVAKELNLYQDDVENVINTFQSSILNHLLEANEEQDIEVKLMDGIRFQSIFVPKHVRRHTNNELIVVPNKLKYTCKFSRLFKDRLTSQYRESRKIWDDWYEAQKSNLAIKGDKND